MFEKDKDLEKNWKSEHSLKEFVDPSVFKSFDELKAKLQAVLGVNEDVPEASELNVISRVWFLFEPISVEVIFS